MVETEYFRDHIPTVSKDGKKRQWIYPKLVKGQLYRFRNILSWFLLALLFAGPFIRINGEPLVLLNILERKFVFFGLIFQPQDFHLHGFHRLIHRYFWPHLVRLDLSANHFHGNAFPENRKVY